MEHSYEEMVKKDFIEQEASLWNWRSYISTGQTNRIPWPQHDQVINTILVEHNDGQGMSFCKSERQSLADPIEGMVVVDIIMFALFYHYQTRSYSKLEPLHYESIYLLLNEHFRCL